MENLWTTKISIKVKRQSLYQGLFVSLAGMAILFGGSLILQDTLACWQRIIPFFTGLLCIFLGQKSYRKICNLEKTPDRLLIWNGALSYACSGTWAFSVALSEIDRFCYLRGQGIGLFFKKPIDAQIHVLDTKFPLASFLIRAKRQGCDLFFEYFEESVKTGLENIMHTQESHDPSFLQDGQNGDQTGRIFFHKAHGIKGQSLR